MDFGPAVYRGSWPGLGRGSWLDAEGGGGRGFVDPGGRARRSGVRGFVNPWGFVGSWIRGFVSWWLGSWVRGLVRALSGSCGELPESVSEGFSLSRLIYRGKVAPSFRVRSGQP